MQPNFTSLSCFALLALCASCYSNRNLVYLQNDTFSEEKSSVVENKKLPYRLQPNDILSVQIKSLADRDVSAIFNVSSFQNSIFASPGNLFLEGYHVDPAGKITLPIIGELTVKDLSLEEAQKLIQEQANKYLTNATVIVKLTSFKVTVLGEVKSPGYYFIYNNQATVLEALGMAGDLTPFGNREKVKLIRQVPSGSEVTLIDLTDARLLRSEFFFLTPGDVLYVEPLKARTRRTNIEILSLGFSAITTAILILSYINNN